MRFYCFYSLLTNVNVLYYLHIMRKFLATIMLCIVLIGAFAPLTFSLGWEIQTAHAQIVQTVYHPTSSSGNGGIIDTSGSVPTTIPTPGSSSAGTITNGDGTQSAGNTPTSTSSNGSNDASNTECGMLDVFCHMFRFWLTFSMFVPHSILTFSALLTDWSIHYSISSDSFRSMNNSGDLVYAGWKITRDFANIGFIFALFIAAFSLIVGKSFLGFEPKKTVVRVIIMALLINFSLFFCRMIIQTGDLFGNLLYNKISAEDAGNSFNSLQSGLSSIESGPDGVLKALGIKGVTLGIISQINPQKLLQDTGADYNISIIQGIGINVKGWAYYVQMGFLSILTLFINLVLILLFMSIAILFTSRVFGLWLLIILAPFAFVSNTIPMLEDNKYFGFKNWLNELIKLSFAAPVFLFFVYLVIIFLSPKVLGLEGINPNWGGFWASTLLIFAKLSAVVFILRKGKKVAFELAGRAGNVAQSIVDKTTGALTQAALAAASGGAAIAARQTLGRAGAALAQSGKVKSLMQGNSFAGRMLGGTLSSAGTRVGAASFDIRNSKRAMDLVGKFGDASGGPIKIGEQFKNEGGFNKEGGIRDVIRGGKSAVDSWMIAQDKKVADKLAVADSEKVSRDLREEEDNLAKTKEAFEAEKSKVDVEAQNQTVNQVITNLNNTLAALQAANPNVTANIARKTALEAVPEAQRTAPEKQELGRLKADPSVTKYQKAEKEIAAFSQALANEPDPAKRNVMTVRLVKQQAENLNEIAKNSIQKEEMDSAKDARDKEKTKLDEAQKEYNNLKKTLDNLGANADPGLRNDVAVAQNKLDEQRIKHQAKEQEFKRKETTYKRDYGDQIKNLEDGAKSAEDAYHEANKGRLRTKQNVMVNQQIVVNNKQNEKDNITYESQLQFSRNLDQLDSRAKVKSADQVRREYLQSKSKTKGKDEKKEDKK